ncbi:MAG: sigma-54 dependent transcriptional regulator [Chitinophagaceae bacterium]
MNKLLIVDDDVDMCLLLNSFLTRKGYKVTTAYTCAQAWDHINSNQPNLVVCDVWLEDMDGITFLKKVKEKFPEIPFVFITAYTDLKTSVNAIKFGALEYVTKPLMPEEISSIIQRALEKAKQSKMRTKQAGVAISEPPVFYYGNTEFFKRLYKQVILIAPTGYNVIIYGESGTGKEAVAREIHGMSDRKNQPFIVHNCSTVTDQTPAVKLFGYSASNDSQTPEYIGCLEMANGGSLLLDEIADLSYEVQQMLIRALKAKKISKADGSETDLDVRIFSSSRENLWQAAQNRVLSEELYNVLNDFTIDILPLRNRKEDIMQLAEHFKDCANMDTGRNVKGFSPEVETIFKNHLWHDNLRELKNIVYKVVVLNEGEYVEASSLPAEICHFSKNGSLVPRHQPGVLG